MDVLPVPNNPAAPEQHQPLTKKECREIVTPYAFMVSDDLLGTPLASPWRRGVAMAIDGVIIAGLASASLLFILPVMLYLSYLRFRLKKFGQVALLLLVTFFLSTTATFAPELLSDKAEREDGVLVDDRLGAAGSAQLAVSVLALNRDKCKQDCIRTELNKTSLQLAKAGVPKDEAQNLLVELLEVTKLPADERMLLVNEVLATYQPQATKAKNAVPAAKSNTVPVEPSSSTEKPWYQPAEGTHSIIGWIKGILADFGLGFGWAMFYFTAYIHWCHGQTIGKKLCQIRVIQLDGSELNVFAAFSRQGGYGAGFATGLMGFLQVFWDPNRQAIQDKVVSTVVIRLNQPKRPLHH